MSWGMAALFGGTGIGVTVLFVDFKKNFFYFIFR